jgi:dTDP-4-amino-4,6-dideoxygalactose transaminase
VIPLAAPDIGDEEIQAVSEVLRSGQLVQGERVAAFERAASAYLGVDHAVAVSSGTAALHVALLALSIGPGDEVIVPDFTFPATANVVELVGATVVLVDVDPVTFNLDLEHVERAISDRTRAVVPVHEFGCPVDIGALEARVRPRGIKIVEDAACALGAAWNGRKVGTWGDAACFSLHPRKAVTTGEGGIVVARTARIADRMRLLRNHGMEKRGDTVDFVCAGFNYRMTELQAAIGLVQMGKLERLIERRRHLAAEYSRALAGTPVRIPVEPPGARHVYQTYHVMLPERISRDRAIAELRAEGIGTNYGANALHLLSHHRQFARGGRFAHSEAAYRSGLALPLFGALREEDARHVAASLAALCQRGEQAGGS